MVLVKELYMSSEEKDFESGTQKKKGLSFPIIIAIIAAGVIVLVVTIIFVISIMMNNMKQSIIEVTGKGTTEQKQSSKEKDSNKDKDDDLSKYEYFETGRIVTNPLNSTQYVVVNLGIFYSKMNAKEEQEPDKEFLENQLKRINAIIKHQVNSHVGDSDISAIQIPRDSLVIKFKDKLIPSFRAEKLKLKDVILVEFIIQ